MKKIHFYLITACLISSFLIFQSGCSKDKEDDSLTPPTTPTALTYGGQTYNIQQIGTQYWLKENMNLGTMIIDTNNQNNNGIIEKYCYNIDTANCATYGGLYQWDEMMQYTTEQGTQGICPEGWHLPTDTEWTILTNFLGGEGIAGGKMKATGTLEAGTGLWYNPNTGATNESGFNALPSGISYSIFSENFIFLGYGTIFWSSSDYNTDNVWGRKLNCDTTDVYCYYYPKTCGFSVRCVKD